MALWQADRVLPGGCPCRVWPTPGLLCALRLICTHTNDCLRGRVSSISCMVWAVRRVHRSSRTPRSCHAVIAAVHHACSHTLGQVRVVSFTGGTATGALVAAAAAPSFKKVSLELGGTQRQRSCSHRSCVPAGINVRGWSRATAQAIQTWAWH